MTEKLYYQDPALLSFEARLLHQSEREGRWSVVLDRTAFYPEGGGQPADQGRLNGAAVIDVQEVDGEIRHTVERPLAAAEVRDGPALPVTGRVDENRRRAFMTAHTAQHVVSAALSDAAGAATVSVHLSQEYFTVELDRQEASEAELQAAESLANRVVAANLPVRVFWEDRENTAGLPLRKPPPAGLERLRLVEIPGHDLSACGGLHVSSTGAIGLVQLAGAERMRGRLRLSWRAGEPAYRAARHNERLLQELTRGLSCGREELIAAMASLQTRAQSADQRAERLCRRLAPLLAGELREAAPRLGAAVAVVTRFDALDSGGGEPGAGEDGELTEAVFRQLLSAPGTVAVLVRREGERLRWLAGHSADLDLDLGALLLPQLPSIEGKGGGRGALWQGVGSKVEGVEAFLAAVNDALRQALGAPGAETQRHGNLA